MRPESAVVTRGQLLRNLRLAAGLSQEQIAIDAGVTQQLLSLFELGRAPGTVKTWRRIARVLRVSVAIFLDEGGVRGR